MHLIDIAKELKRQVGHFRDRHEKSITTYSLDARIIGEKNKGKTELYLEGMLSYRTNFEEYPPGTKRTRAINSGRMSFAPTKKIKARKD